MGDLKASERRSLTRRAANRKRIKADKKHGLWGLLLHCSMRLQTFTSDCF